MAELAHLLVPLLALAAVEPPASATALRFRLEARASYRTGQPVPIRFILENRSNGPLFVLSWYTPLEGIKGEIFQVTRDGNPLPYLGRLVKRGAPRAQDYLRIEPHGSRSATVDLATVYDLGRPGDYQVRFAGRVHDVVREAGALPRAPDQHRPLDVPGGPVRFSVR